MTDDVEFGDLGRTTIGVPRKLKARVTELAERINRDTGRSIGQDEVVERAVDLLEKQLIGEGR